MHLLPPVPPHSRAAKHTNLHTLLAPLRVYLSLTRAIFTNDARTIIAVSPYSRRMKAPGASASRSSRRSPKPSPPSHGKTKARSPRIYNNPDSVRHNPRFAKYTKLLRLRLGMHNVLVRMAQDGCTQAEIDAFKEDRRLRAAPSKGSARKKSQKLEAHLRNRAAVPKSRTHPLGAHYHSHAPRLQSAAKKLEKSMILVGLGVHFGVLFAPKMCPKIKPKKRW